MEKKIINLIMEPVTADVDKIVYKILVVGDVGVGKTSLIRKYTTNTFSLNYKATIGADFHIKKIDDGLHLQLWDIAGQERFQKMTRTYYKEGRAAIIVYDVGRNTTLNMTDKWLEDINEKVKYHDKNIPVILVGSKLDLKHPGTLSPDNMDEYIKDKGYRAWYDVSSKTGENIDELFNKIINIIKEEDAAIDDRLKEINLESTPIKQLNLVTLDKKDGDVEKKACCY